MVLASGEFEAATAENSIELLEEAYLKYQHISPIREVITDHGSQFYANKRDSDGNATHSFEEFCKIRGILHILVRYNHPQSNVKVERWFQEYKRKRKDYETFEDFIRGIMRLDLIEFLTGIGWKRRKKRSNASSGYN